MWVDFWFLQLRVGEVVDWFGLLFAVGDNGVDAVGGGRIWTRVEGVLGLGLNQLGALRKGFWWRSLGWVCGAFCCGRNGDEEGLIKEE